MDSKQLLKDLFQAYYDARKNKRGTINALSFEMNFEKNLFELRDELTERRYRIRPSICFINLKPVKREIFAADFRDRVVHHLIFNYIGHIFEKQFIFDSYSCRDEKGTSLGVKRLDHFIRSCSENYRKDCWILKLDIKGYFMAMDRNILYEKTKKVLGKKEEELKTDLDFALYLLRKIIFNDPTKNCIVRGKRENWIGLPKSKSLFFSGIDKGFPIGNLTSQLFGNIYLDGFDHFAKEKLGLKYYGRYVDDIVAVHKSREFLKQVIGKIKSFVQKIGLKIHEKKIYLQHFKRGVLFLGTYLKPWRNYSGRRTKDGLFRSVKRWNRLLKEKEKLEKSDCLLILASANSYLGIMKNCRTFRLREKFLKMLDGRFWEYFLLEENLEKLVLNKDIFQG
jgi:RNA-directed DNA polymerase